MASRKQKPCEVLEHIRCLGQEGSCFGWLYWDFPESGKMVPMKKRKKVSELDRCPFAGVIREMWKRGKL
jgi:hypothetical protein